MDKREVSWYVEHHGRVEELILAAKLAADAAEEARKVAVAARNDALQAAQTNIIFEGYPLSVDRFGEQEGQVEVSSPANVFLAKAYESQHSGMAGKWYVNLQQTAFGVREADRLVPHGGQVFHLGYGVSREQAVLDAKRWVAFQVKPESHR